MPSAISSGSGEAMTTPVSPTTSGSAPASVTTGTAPQSMLSASERPKASCCDACTAMRARHSQATFSSCETRPVKMTLGVAIARSRSMAPSIHAPTTTKRTCGSRAAARTKDSSPLRVRLLVLTPPTVTARSSRATPGSA